MSGNRKIYVAIDLKSFYASVECVARGLDALNTNLVVADKSRTEKTICLAVTPSLKSYGISGRARLFEVVQKVREVNALRLKKAPGHKFIASSHFADELNSDPALELDYIVAPPQMGEYMRISTRIYDIYLRYVAPEDIHVYSIDEVFIDATSYLRTYRLTPHDFTMMLIHDVLNETGITATAGIGTNMYLAKIAMDIVAKKMPPDKDGVRIAALDEMSYRRKLWAHRPLTDFWRIGRGYSRKLESYGLYTMGDVARCSLGSKYDYFNEDLLYKLFGVNAELLIDHAWGWEPCKIPDIKSFKPETHSLSTGQVLKCPYNFEKGRLIVREMTDLLVLDMVDKGIVADQMVLTVGYDIESDLSGYTGAMSDDGYGRPVPKSAHGTVNLPLQTASTEIIVGAVVSLYERIVNPDLLIRRMYVVANNIVPESCAEKNSEMPEQMDLFTDYEQLDSQKAQKEKFLAREKEMQKAILKIQKKYGRNAVLKGMNFQDGGTTIERNGQVGGHKA